jgi:hypothetical protein
MLQRRTMGLILAFVLLDVHSGWTETVTLEPSKDNTLYQDAEGDLSNGAGNHLFAGRTGSFPGVDRTIRRGLLAFDVSGSIPAGSTIVSATLTLTMSQTPAGAELVRLRRVLADWGEGDSVASMGEGGGAAAQPGDATWLYRFFDPNEPVPWASPGGDFAPTSSATLRVESFGVYTWGPTPELVADVQSWVDQPSQNFGWLLLGDESRLETAKRFDSREHPNPPARPQLFIDYDLPGAPTRTPTPSPTPTATPTATPTPVPVTDRSGRSPAGVIPMILVTAAVLPRALGGRRRRSR